MIKLLNHLQSFRKTLRRINKREKKLLRKKWDIWILTHLEIIQLSVKKITFCDETSFLKWLATRFEQITSVHYQAISHTYHSNWQFFFRSSNLHKIGKISKKLITEVHRAQQTMWQELIQTDREGRNVRSDSSMVYLSL